MSDDGVRRLLEIMAALRDPERGCPWDREQDFASISRYTIEEAYEVADAIARGDLAELKDELGDLLFQVVFYAQMAREQGAFEFADVVAAINHKMLRRHPHVFGDERVADATAQTEAWERLKAAERRQRAGADTPPGVLDGVARALPALMRAEKLQKRAAKVGFDWETPAGVAAKIREELAELEQALATGESRGRLQEEMGDLLFSCVNLARHLGLDAEQSLRAGNDKFERRFRAMEGYLAAAGLDPATATPEALENAWEAVKGGDPAPGAEEETGHAGDHSDQHQEP